MKTISKAVQKDLEAIVNIDKEIIGDDSRKKYIQKAIDEGQCMVAKSDNNIVGFLVFDTHFFGCSFISLIIVKKTEWRKGYATLLIQNFINEAPTKKIFSSTNLSNERMKAVFRTIGFIESGIVENLDEGDPEIIYFISN